MRVSQVSLKPQVPHLIGAGRVTDCSRGSDGASCLGWIPAPYRGTGQALRGNDGGGGSGGTSRVPTFVPKYEIHLTTRSPSKASGYPQHTVTPAKAGLQGRGLGRLFAGTPEWRDHL